MFRYIRVQLDGGMNVQCVSCHVWIFLVSYSPGMEVYSVPWGWSLKCRLLMLQNGFAGPGRRHVPRLKEALNLRAADALVALAQDQF